MKRAGGQALFLLSAPLNVHILKALEAGPKGLMDLRRTVGSPPQSTMRVYTRTLVEVGILERRREAEFPATVSYQLTATGRALLRVGDALQAWLRLAPEGPIPLASTIAKSATRALVEGWSTNIVRALAAKPQALTELSRLISQTSYPSLERRLGAMRLTNQVEPQPGEGRGTPYRVTSWLRQAVVPLTVAAAWERRYVPDITADIGRLDVEAAFLLGVPLLELPTSTSGECRLVVEVRNGTSPFSAGVLIRVEEGKVVFCTSRLDGEAEAWVSGSPVAWFRALSDDRGNEFDVGGDVALAGTITNALRAKASSTCRT
jgi:DNA-binding HxlR family transcriptional regulator